MTDEQSYSAALMEIRKVRERLAKLEEIAAQGPSPNLESLLGDRFAPFVATPVDPGRKALENAAKFYSPTEEAAFRQREKDPERYDRDLAAAGGDLLAQSIALAGRDAHIKLTHEED